MAVGLSTQTKDPNKKGVIATAIADPKTRKRVTCGCVVLVVAVVLGVLAVLGISAYMGYWTADMLTRKKNIDMVFDMCDDEPYYTTPFHGERPWQVELDYQLAKVDYIIQSVYDDGTCRVTMNEWFEIYEDVFTMEIFPFKDCPQPTTFMVDSYNGMVAIKADLKDGAGYRCMVIESENLPWPSDIRDDVYRMMDSGELGTTMTIKEIIPHFFRIGRPVIDANQVGSAIHEMCQDFDNYDFLHGFDDEFRQEVARLMDQYGVTYDDMYEWIHEFDDAVVTQNHPELQALLQRFPEVFGMFPYGTMGDTGPNGLGWSLNIITDPTGYPEWERLFEFTWETE